MGGIALLGATLLWVAPFASAQERITALVWPSEAGLPNVPERRICDFLAAGETDGSGRSCPTEGRLHARPSFGIAFSGGGTRSAAATIGELRALSALGLLDKARYVAAVSGGSWATVSWIFAPEGFSEADLLGRYTLPEQIDAGSLADPGAIGRIASSISGAHLAEPFLDAAVMGARDEKYARALDSAFLAPIDIGGSETLFTYDQRSAEDIGARNPWLQHRPLRTTHEGRPFLIALGALTTVRGVRKAEWVPFEMTPLYVGAPALSGWNIAKPWGGGYVESFVYDADLCAREVGGDERQVAGEWVRGQGNVFRLSDVIGTSGAAPADIVDRLDLLGLLGFPRFHHWPVKGTLARPSRTITATAAS
jgi:hypothetical protein